MFMESLCNDFAKNVDIFGVNNSSSHTDNHKNNFSELSEEPSDNINGSVSIEEQKFRINFSTKAKTKLC